MKKLIFLIAFVCQGLVIFACPACEKQQPKLLRGITHGAGPSGNMDYVIVIAAVLLTGVIFFYALKWMIKPGEKDLNHIKRTVLN